MSDALAKSTYERSKSLAGHIGYEAYDIQYDNGCHLYGIRMGNVVISLNYMQITVGGYKSESAKQSRDELVLCLQEYGLRLEKIRVCIAAALPQPIAEEVLEHFTILPALARHLLKINNYTFERDYNYYCYEQTARTYDIDDPLCYCVD